MGVLCLKCLSSPEIDEKQDPSLEEPLKRTKGTRSDFYSDNETLKVNFNEKAEKIEIVVDDQEGKSVSDNEKVPINLNDFEQIKILGKGSFGKVVLVKRKNTSITT